jgi:hypothetical protein
MSKPILTRRRLVVINKALLYSLISFFIYVFINGLLGNPEPGKQTAYSNHININNLAEGEYRIESYRTQMILVLHRSEKMLQQLQHDNPDLVDPQSKQSQQPPHSMNAYRSQYPQYLIVHAYDPDSSCQLVINTQGSNSGIRDLCSGNRYDWAGRAIKPARVNLTVPNYDLSGQLGGAANNRSLP